MVVQEVNCIAFIFTFTLYCRSWRSTAFDWQRCGQHKCLWLGATVALLLEVRWCRYVDWLFCLFAQNNRIYYYKILCFFCFFFLYIFNLEQIKPTSFPYAWWQLMSAMVWSTWAISLGSWWHHKRRGVSGNSLHATFCLSFWKAEFVSVCVLLTALMQLTKRWWSQTTWTWYDL